MNSYGNISNKHISVVLTSRTLKLKSECRIDENAITNVLYSKLCVVIYTASVPTIILEYFVLYFKFYLVTSILLREWHLRCINLTRLFSAKIQDIYKKRSPYKQYHIGSPYQYALDSGAARVPISIIFTFFTCHGTHVYLYIILAAVYPGPMVPHT